MVKASEWVLWDVVQSNSDELSHISSKVSNIFSWWCNNLTSWICYTMAWYLKLLIWNLINLCKLSITIARIIITFKFYSIVISGKNVWDTKILTRLLVILADHKPRSLLQSKLLNITDDSHRFFSSTKDNYCYAKL